MSDSVPFTLIFTCSRSLASRAIRWWTGEHITHVAIGFTFCEIPLVLEADGHGVRTHLRARVVAERDVVAELLPPEGLRLHEALRCLDMPYDYRNIVGFFWVYLLRRLGRVARNPLGTRGAVICSELVLRMDQRGEVEAWRGLDRETTSPFQLYEACLLAGLRPARR